MYKIDFELNVVLPEVISSAVILDNNKAIYDKISSSTSANIINGHLSLKWEKDCGSSAWVVRLIGSGFVMSNEQSNEVFRKLKEVLYEELRSFDKNIQIDIRYYRSITLNFTHSLFILLIAKIKSMFRGLKQKFLVHTT